MDDLRQRDPRRRDSDYMGAIAQLPCIACLAMAGHTKRGVHVAHVRFADSEGGWRSVGMQEKPHDRRSAPLCPNHHTNGVDAQHRMNERAFWERVGVDIIRMCADLSAAFDGGQNMRMVLAKHAGLARRKRMEHRP